MEIRELSLLIAAMSNLVAAAAIAAFIAGRQKQYNDSIQPQLSMSLVKSNSSLYLRIENVGQTAAKNIGIRLTGIKNNGSSNNLQLDDRFTDEFDLYPEETVQGEVAIYSNDISQSEFLQVDCQVSYLANGAKKTTTYTRTVTYAAAPN